MYKSTQHPALSGCGGGLRPGGGVSLKFFLLSWSRLFNKVKLKTVYFSENEGFIGFPAFCCSRCSCVSWCWGGEWRWGLDDSVGQVVTERHGNGQGLHLLRGHHSAEGHPAQVLQTGNATRTLPEVHITITSPLTKKNKRWQIKKEKGILSNSTLHWGKRSVGIFKLNS